MIFSNAVFFLLLFCYNFYSLQSNGNDNSCAHGCGNYWTCGRRFQLERIPLVSYLKFFLIVLYHGLISNPLIYWVFND